MKPIIKQLTRLEDIHKTIKLFDADFEPTLSQRGIDLKDYAQKLYQFALVYTLLSENEESGFVAFYANDTELNTAYLAQIAVKPQYGNRGNGYALLKLAMEISRGMGMHTMKLEVYHQNHSAIAFYKKHGFTFCSDPNGTFYQMQKAL